MVDGKPLSFPAEKITINNIDDSEAVLERKRQMEEFFRCQDLLERLNEERFERMKQKEEHRKFTIEELKSHCPVIDVPTASLKGSKRIVRTRTNTI